VLYDANFTGDIFGATSIEYESLELG